MVTATVHVPEEDRSFFAAKPLLSKHNLHTLSHFSDSDLIDLLDNIPRSNLRVWTADESSNNPFSYMYVDTTGISGKDIYDCVLRGEFWINLLRVDKFYDKYKNISDELYHGLSEQCPHLKVEYIHSYILLSSPNMHFYLHIDSYENMFWCIRGGKKFHLYPPDDRRIVSQDFMEDICSSAREDFVPFEETTLYKEYQITPGDMLSWPQHSPHEFVNNGDLNVGLGTFHGTEKGHNRVLNYQSSRYFREHFPLLRGNVRHGAFGTILRRNLYRGIRRLGYTPVSRQVEFWADYKLDPELPKCVSKIGDGPVMTEFSRLATS